MVIRLRPCTNLVHPPRPPHRPGAYSKVMPSAVGAVVLLSGSKLASAATRSSSCPVNLAGRHERICFGAMIGMAQYGGMRSKFAFKNMTISTQYVSIRLRFGGRRLPQALKSHPTCAAEAWFPKTCCATGARLGYVCVPWLAHQASTAFGSSFIFL